MPKAKIYFLAKKVPQTHLKEKYICLKAVHFLTFSFQLN